MKRADLLNALDQGALTQQLTPVYGQDAPTAALRLKALVLEYADTFPCGENDETLLFSAPGRTELGGNHTDHQNGRALAASVDLDTIACVVPNASNRIRIKSRNHRMAEIDLNDLAVREKEKGNSISLVRGVAARIREMGYSIGGFDAYTTTRVLRGSGLSSSAAFEVLVASIMNQLFCGGQLSSTQLAQIGQYVENVYFNKPCGLLDQLACATGGVVSIDFADPAEPHIEQVQISLPHFGYALCIVDSHASHADLTADYASIPYEMKQVAAFFGKEVLRQVDAENFFSNMAAVAEQCGHRAALRAYHYFLDDRRVPLQHAALERGDFDAFLRHVNQSGRSSFMYLQNVSTYRDSANQPLALLLAAAEHLLQGRGAYRIHGGGFAGTIQAFVPLDMLDSFRAGMEAVAGKGSCHVLTFRNVGAVPLVL